MEARIAAPGATRIVGSPEPRPALPARLEIDRTVERSVRADHPNVGDHLAHALRGRCNARGHPRRPAASRFRVRFPDVRLPRVVARAALIAALASIVVPAVAGSRIPSAPQALDPAAFHEVDLGLVADDDDDPRS